MMNLNRDEAIVDKILPIMLKEEARGLLTFFNELFDKYFPEKSEEEVNYYFQEMVASGLIVPWRGSEYKAELAPLGREVINRGGWLRYLADEEKRRKKEKHEKEEDRELNRRSAEAAERAAKSAEKSADWSVSSARTSKWSMWASWVLLAITLGGIALSAKVSSDKVKEAKELEVKLGELQREVEQLKGMREEVDSLRAVVKVLGEKGPNPAGMKSIFY